MRILQLCPKVPWPPDDGGRVAMRVLALSLLEAGAEVRTLSLNPLKHRTDVSTLPDEALPLRIEAIDADTSVTPAGALRSLLAGTSYNVDRFRSPALEARLRAVAAEWRPDVVLLESLFMVPSLPALRRATAAPAVLRSVNVEHEVWERLGANARGALLRPWLRLLASRLRAYEVGTMDSVDAILPVTEEDARTYRRLGARAPLHVTPVGMDPREWPDLSGRGEPDSLVFLGSLDWRPNLEAVRWFVGEVWPRVKAENPRARFRVAGSNPPRALAGEALPDGVELLGRVADARAFFASGSAMVVPLLSGGGVRVKILEAMALGVPVVSTRLGATGIAAEDGREILLADDPASLASACNRLLRDREAAVRLGREGRAKILEGHGAARIAMDLMGFLRGLVQPSRACAAKG
mgnify:CR=1 FL=1